MAWAYACIVPQLGDRHGPAGRVQQEIWDEIDAALGKGKFEVAAAALRHHLEYVSKLLADQIGTTPPFRAGANYELGEMLPPVLSRMKDLRYRHREGRLPLASLRSAGGFRFR